MYAIGIISAFNIVITELFAVRKKKKITVFIYARTT